MTHYVCLGECGGVSETAGVCNTEGCSKHQHNLVECNCQDNKHEEVLRKK